MLPPLSVSEEIMTSDTEPGRENGRRDGTIIDRLVIGLDAERQRALIGVCYVLRLTRVNLHDGNWQQRLLNAGIISGSHSSENRRHISGSKARPACMDTLAYSHFRQSSTERPDTWAEPGRLMVQFICSIFEVLDVEREEREERTA